MTPISAADGVNSPEIGSTFLQGLNFESILRMGFSKCNAIVLALFTASKCWIVPLVIDTHL